MRMTLSFAATDAFAGARARDLESRPHTTDVSVKLMANVVLYFQTVNASKAGS